jgi:MbtH protein
MALDNNEDLTVYRVVVNHEEQYSILPDYKENPLGWGDAGKTGSKEECLNYIRETWTDVRPLDLRKIMEMAEQEHDEPKHDEQEHDEQEHDEQEHDEQDMDEQDLDEQDLDEQDLDEQDLDEQDLDEQVHNP